MACDVLWHDPVTGHRITRSALPSDATVQLLSETVWGSRSTKYRILNIQAKLDRLRAPDFFVLSEHDRELCVFVLDKCRKRVSGVDCEAYHFVMASTVPHRQHEGLAGLLIEQVRSYCVRSVGRPGLGFAYVEETTEFSLQLSEQIGHSVEAVIPITFFTRLFPSMLPDMDKLLPSEESSMRSKLRFFYRDHELTDFEDGLRTEDFFVVRRQGAVVAAVQVEMLEWSIVSLPGAMGTILLSVLPSVPFFDRFLNLKDFRLLRFGNLFFEKGEEGTLLGLLEACLCECQSKAGMIMMDERSSVLAGILKKRHLGMLSNMVSSSAILRVDVVGMDQDLLRRLREQPLMVSAGDVF